MRVKRGGRKRPVPGGNTRGKPKNQGINQLKFERNKRSVAEVRPIFSVVCFLVLRSVYGD